MTLVMTAAMNAAATADEPVPERRAAELRHLVKHDCGSCHGLKLKGGLGPALTPQALEGRPVKLLQNTILDGREGTAMPPWRPFMSEEEARWIVERLKGGDVVDE